jgi:hypothetical protein
MLTDAITLERLVTAAILASLAIVVAFGPELGRAMARLRNRRLSDVVTEAPSVSVEARQ